MKRFVFILVTAPFLFFLFTGCLGSGNSSHPGSPYGNNKPVQTGTEETLCFQFVRSQLTDNGGIHTRFLPGGEGGELSAGHEVLSESQGLMLRYASAIGDEGIFKETLSFIRTYLDTGDLISYRLQEDGKPYPINAAVDDLRIIRGLLEGSQAFHDPKYQELAVSYGSRLQRTNVKEDILLDFYDAQYQMTNRFMTLCYGDLKTISALSRLDPNWDSVLDKTRDIILNGYLGDEFPFFQTRYLVEESRYESSADIQMIESLLTALHLAEDGSCPDATTKWLRETLLKGPVYHAYTIDGVPAGDMESTAIYALCVQLGSETGDIVLENAAMERMQAFQVMDQESKVYGAFADSATCTAYSFDNLTALLAFRKHSGWQPGLLEGG